jgi:hypothetical protein
MNDPWQYDETTQIGTDYGDPKEVGDYDETHAETAGY